ncbi:uncharacterized protein LOC114861098 isoform X2 [Betta splendens]|uniref:Uncharacterized protein LOC114861098 isoform X2 n=1 Tax=Betta splendens TaxID=158456 RepID=A0A6P7N937_BETSP|nr:uncharacterized protein LOC114861098 isoform X2 [Betta splendens]
MKSTEKNRSVKRVKGADDGGGKVQSEGQFVEETCEEFEVSDWSPVVHEGSTPWNLIIGLSALLIIMLIIGILLCCYWRKFVGLLQSCCCHRVEGCWLSCPSRCHKDDGSQVSTTGDVATPPDDVMSLTEVVTSEPHGNGENQQDNITGTVQANGKLKDDPGGASAVGTLNQNNGCTHGDRGPEGQQLLDQRAAVHSSEMTAEAVALVNKHDFDPDRVDTCSTALLHETRTWSQT